MAVVDLESWSKQVLVLPDFQVKFVAESREVDVESGGGVNATLPPPHRVHVLHWNVLIVLFCVPHHRVSDFKI